MSKKKPPDWPAFLRRTAKFIEKHIAELPSTPTVSDASMALLYLNHLNRQLAAYAQTTDPGPGGRDDVPVAPLP